MPNDGFFEGTSAAPFHVQKALASLAKSVPAIFLAFAIIACAWGDAASCSGVGSSAALPAPASGMVVSVFVVPKPVAVLLGGAPPCVPRCPLPWPANATGVAINDAAINNAKNRNLTI